MDLRLPYNAIDAGLDSHFGSSPLAPIRRDYSDELLASHRWIGGNTAVPYYYRYKEQLRQTEAFLRTGKVHVDIFAVRKVEAGKPDSPWVAPLNSTGFAAKPGDEVEVAVVIQNRGLGHSLVPEQRDIFEAWVDFDVKDRRGNVITESGAVRSGGFVDPNAHSFVTKMLDRNGSLLTRHEVWLRHFVGTDATIPSGRSTVVCYQFSIPKSASGQLYLSAKVLYRHFNEAFTRFVLGADHPLYPIVDMASDTEKISVGPNGSFRPTPTDDPDWLRWNNFGIGLLQAEWYPDAAAAFEHVAKLRPDYADAHTNQAIVYLEDRQYALAESELTTTLGILPDDPRALFYRGVVRRARGDFSGAAFDLVAVRTRYPDSLDVNRELGLTEYFLGNSERSINQFLRVQAEDPDDLVSHYYLALLYRRQGQLDLATAERERFVDEDPFPNAFANTLQALRGQAGMVERPHASYVHVLAVKCRGDAIRCGSVSWPELPKATPSMGGTTPPQ